ncbi:helix-turn-helix transcriptional regulator [Sphingomonas aurantiaca]|uniref:helix-turn-helix domain-containing protein n=1 Tax=Sphingomonas TaxID=13687 RepID=UPI000AA54564|nr:helix-turn-helix transcriptional regulator [Sphingomonas sp. Leaf28]
MARTRTNKTPIMPDQVAPRAAAAIVLDPFRAVIFPNRIRELRRANGLPKLMALSDRLPDIPYIRLSKIERGEVVARADEVRTIAAALDTTPAALLVDVEAPGFDIAVWAQPFQDGRPVAIDEERVAVMLAAALRMLRGNDRALTISVLDTEYGLPPVILSRLENAHKTLDRWNAATVAALCRLFDVADEAALRKHIDGLYRRGELDGQVGRIVDPQIRIARTRERNAALMQELESPPERPRKRTSTTAAKAKRPARPAAAAGTAAAVRTLPVYGTALPGGLIAGTSVDAAIDAPGLAGPRAFGLRVCRATLGAGLPASATVVVDPDRPPVVGGLAAIRVDDGYRLLTVACDRSGATMGYSVTPDIAVALDDLDPAQVHAIIAAIFPT